MLSFQASSSFYKVSSVLYHNPYFVGGSHRSLKMFKLKPRLEKEKQGMDLEPGDEEGGDPLRATRPIEHLCQRTRTTPS